MGIVLKHEEKRCGYISEQTQLMTSVEDDFNPSAAFQIILEKCSLANNIKKMYDDLCSTGMFHKIFYMRLFDTYIERFGELESEQVDSFKLLSASKSASVAFERENCRARGHRSVNILSI